MSGARGRRWPLNAIVGGIVVILATACGPAPTPRPSTSGALPSASLRPSASSAPDPSIPPARWSDCGRGFQCTTIAVPLDYSTGTGAMNLSLVRLPARDRATRIGSLLLNPGGPGGSGVEFLRDGLALFPDSLRRRFDLVGFDPRGVNLSTGIRCIDNLDGRADLDPSPDNAAEAAALVADATSYAKACQRRNAAVLPFLSTDDVVRDLESIRIGLGEDKISYLGFSYGTLIGALYADRYPDHVRAMALDGAIDPALSLAQVRTGQAMGFQTELNRFLAACAKRRDCLLGRGAQVRRGFDALMRRIDGHPLPSRRAHDKRTVGPGLAWTAILGAMYSKESWPTLEFALALAEHGDGSIFLAIADPYRGRKPNGEYSNQQDAYTANTCLDFPASTNPADYAAFAKTLQGVSPDFGAQSAYNDLTCAFWPVKATRTPGPVSAAGAPPIVVVGTTGDPATPLAWATALARELTKGVLVTNHGDGHTGYASSGCVRDVVIKYLVSLKPPRTGTTCR